MITEKNFYQNMSEPIHTRINNKWIVANRGKKNVVDSQKPYGWLVEKELNTHGVIEDTAIIFLTNKTCPFYCIMCDLWKNTTDKSVPKGAIPNQIEWALQQLPKVKLLKLYNSGSFFDKKAIPEADYPRIADLLKDFETVIVESHPKFIDEKVLRFKALLKPELQVAIGLETVQEKILKQLNKQMTLDSFKNAVNYLTKNNIKSRAFILLKTPYMSESEGIYWAKKSIDFAFAQGVECCTVIPVRAGNGAMDLLLEQGDFSLPNIQSLEMVLEYGISLNAGRVFADVWDLNKFSNCKKCFKQRTIRINNLNLTQKLSNRMICPCNTYQLAS